VADRVDIFNCGEKMPLVVEKISLLYSVFTRIDKMQIVQVWMAFSRVVIIAFIPN